MCIFVTPVNKMKRLVRILVVVSAVLLVMSSCNKQDRPEPCIMPANCVLEEGDVVFRQGVSMESDLVMLAQGREGMYSHCGIVVDSAGVKMIVHAVPDEPDFEGDVNRVKMDSPECFYMQSRASRGEVMRCDDPAVAQAAAAQAMHYYKAHMLFNDDYDDADTTRLYCTQLVLRAYAAAGVKLNTGEARRYSVPGVFDVKCILPVQVHSCGYFKSVMRFATDANQVSK